MSVSHLTRRQLLRLTAWAGTVSLLGNFAKAGIATKGKTPPLSQQEIAAIEKALGKKGTYNEAQAVHNTPFPRNDLQVKVKGEAVPIPFGFGGWAAIKKTVDGKSAVLMSDTVLLE